MIMSAGYVPYGFRLSYTVPLPKADRPTVSSANAVDNYRAISISPILSKIFERRILKRPTVNPRTAVQISLVLKKDQAAATLYIPSGKLLITM